MICIVDYGLGNLGSLANMLKRIGAKSVISCDKEDISSSSHLILPGVGAFDKGAANLKERNLFEILGEEVLVKSKPILGICLGAQLMLESSEEGTLSGLGWIPGKVVRFSSAGNIKIPHMGWNNVTEIKDEQLFASMPDAVPRFYFVHSYHFNVTNQADITGQTFYGTMFPSSFRRKNILGVQFHPEKSHIFGLQLLRNFIFI